MHKENALLDSIVLIQARFNSKRLPGKALLEISGIPLVVLAAKRAGNTGKRVVVLTSEEKSDDAICRVLESEKIEYFRGNLKNVLDRFTKFAEGLQDEQIVFRLTADNVLPDGELLDDLEIQFRNSNAAIMGCTSEGSDVPYGVSAEIFLVRALREAHSGARSQYDLEHVTPYIYRNKPSLHYHSQIKPGLKRLRVTIDNQDDFFCVKSLFAGVSDPILASIPELLSNYRNMKYHPRYPVSKKPLTLGTVQFGSNYGITNKSGKVSVTVAEEILKHSITEGIQAIDTAQGYGSSEEVIGDTLQGGWSHRVNIITKLPPLIEAAELSEVSQSIFVRDHIAASLKKLRQETIYGMLVHRASHLKQKSVVDELLNARDAGLIENIGVSVQTPSELDEALLLDWISIVQLPFNILDFRWKNSIMKVKEVKAQRGLKIYARSSLLQGLITSKNSTEWARAGLENANSIIAWLEEMRICTNSDSLGELGIRFVNSQDWVDSVVIGVTSKLELFSNLQSGSKETLSVVHLKHIEKTRPDFSPEILDPSTWSIHV